MSTTQDFSTTRGDSWAVSLTFKKKDGSAINITGDIVRFALKTHVDDTAVILSKTVQNHVDPAHGLSAISISSAETKTLAVGRYVYDIVWHDNHLGTVSTLVSGPFHVLRGVANEVAE